MRRRISEPSLCSSGGGGNGGGDGVIDGTDPVDLVAGVEVALHQAAHQ